MRKKNIVLITIDDGNAFWRYRDAFGARLLTPGLDRIFDASAAFTSAYCQTPICGPSRASLLSGLAPHQTGVLDNYTNLFSVLRPEQLWQYRLKRAGYYCSTAGKVHHAFAPQPPHIHNVLYSHPAKPLTLGPPRSVPFKRFGGFTGGAATTDPSDDKLYYDHQSARDAAAFFDSYDGEAPFYREIGFHHPHLPLKTPLPFKEIYDEDLFEQPRDWLKGFDLCDYPNQFMIENLDIRDKEFWRRTLRNYFSAYSHVDSHINTVWQALKASRHAENTVLIFTSDHGYHLGDKNRFRKFTLWEESCRVPLLICDPDATPQEITAPVSLLDVGPTILDYAGCPPLAQAPGLSLRDVVHGARAPDRGALTFLYGNVSMRKGSHRITLYQNGESEFHDVDKDPWLTKNTAQTDPAYPQMRQDLIAESARHGLQITDADTERSGVTNFVMPLPGSKAGAGAPSKGAIEIGPTPGSNPPPRFRVHYTTLDGDGQANLPNGYARMHYGADTGGTTEHLRVCGNHADNEFSFPGSQNRFRLEVHTGPGENHVRSQQDDLIVYGGPGNNTMISGTGNCVFYGGTGTSVMQGGKGRAVLHGGPGSAVMQGGIGTSVFTCGAGKNQLRCGPDDNHITIDGGSNQIIASPGVALVLKRTGLPQEVKDFTDGTIDVSDWAVMGPITLISEGPDTYLSCQTDQVIFRKTSPKQIRQNLIGANLVST